MIFCPCWVTSQTGPTFSVISMRPSGKNAIRHGRLKVVTVVMLKGTAASGFCSPAFTWAQTAAETKVSSSAAVATFSFIDISPSSYSHQNGFCFGVQIYTVGPLFAADAALLETAERQRRIDQVMAVHPHRAG